MTFIIFIILKLIFFSKLLFHIILAELIVLNEDTGTIQGFQTLSSRDASEPEEPQPFPTLPSFPTLSQSFKENSYQSTTPSPYYYQPVESQQEQYDEIYIDENGLFQTRGGAVAVNDKQDHFEEYTNVARTAKDVSAAQSPALFNGLPVFSD